MGNDSYGSPIDQLASYVTLYLSNNGQNCEGYRYTGTVASLAQYQLTSPSVVSGGKFWKIFIISIGISLAIRSTNDIMAIPK